MIDQPFLQVAPELIQALDQAVQVEPLGQGLQPFVQRLEQGAQGIEQVARALRQGLGRLFDGMGRRLQEPPQHGLGRPFGLRLVGPVVIGRIDHRPLLPAAVDPLPHQDRALGIEGGAETGQGRSLGPPQFLVALHHHRQGVVVGAQEAVDAVFLDAAVIAAPGGAFAAQAPAHLIEGDVVFRRPVGLVGQLERGGEAGDAAPQYGDLLHVSAVRHAWSFAIVLIFVALHQRAAPAGLQCFA